MSDDAPIAIEAQSAPLSHLKQQHPTRPGVDRRVYPLVIALVAVLALVFYFADSAIIVDTPTQTAEVTRTENAGADANNPNDARSLPFAETQQKLARERAQQALAGFVEQQIQLEADMQVDTWGQAELAAALARAQSGDLKFASEAYDEAIADYAAATAQLKTLIDQGRDQVSELLHQATAAVTQQDVKRATELVADARIIAPDDKRLGPLEQRITQLPQVIDLLRTAKNHELGERYAQALETYQQVNQLDPQTKGLDSLIDGVKQGAQRLAVTQHISRGFAALEKQDFAVARGAFNAALAIDSNDSIARGGLEQVARENDLSVIEGQRRRAERALAAEDWSVAAAAYESILEMDKNIQFAVSGLTTARAHETSVKLLTAINNEPTRLSSQSLYLQAQEIVKQARELSHRGPELNALVDTSAQLLTQYKDPVMVQLISDSLTDVIMSNVGRLGFFAEKQISLRPGEYTIRGSQDGCRDLYMSVLVVPGIEPIDLRCQSRL